MQIVLATQLEIDNSPSKLLYMFYLSPTNIGIISTTKVDNTL